MKLSITSGLEGPEASIVEDEYQSSLTMRKRLVELLEKKQENMLKKRRGEEAYASPHWPLLQADGVGYERAISEVISLLR